MTDDQLTELFEERAAIRQYDGGMPRHEAEIAAYWDVRRQVGNGVPMPRAIQETLAATRKRQRELVEIARS